MKCLRTLPFWLGSLVFWTALLSGAGAQPVRVAVAGERHLLPRNARLLVFAFTAINHYLQGGST